MRSDRSTTATTIGIVLAAALVGAGIGAAIGLAQRPSARPSAVSPDATAVPTTPPPASTSTSSSPPSASTTEQPPASSTTALSAPRTTLAPAPSGWRAEMLTEVNRRRGSAGADSLSWCPALALLADDYAEVLRDWERIAHTGPDGSTLSSRLATSGYTGWSLAGENLASGQPDATSVLAAWFDSTPHRDNLLNPSFTHFAIARADATESGRTVPYWVQVFGAGGRC